MMRLPFSYNTPQLLVVASKCINGLNNYLLLLVGERTGKINMTYHVKVDLIISISFSLKLKYVNHKVQKIHHRVLQVRVVRWLTQRYEEF
jgi:hypothetical protein